jgi:hypothetical protein
MRAEELDDHAASSVEAGDASAVDSAHGSVAKDSPAHRRGVQSLGAAWSPSN